MVWRDWHVCCCAQEASNMKLCMTEHMVICGVGFGNSGTVWKLCGHWVCWERAAENVCRKCLRKSQVSWSRDPCNGVKKPVTWWCTAEGIIRLCSEDCFLWLTAPASVVTVTSAEEDKHIMASAGQRLLYCVVHRSVVGAQGPLGLASVADCASSSPLGRATLQWLWVVIGLWQCQACDGQSAGSRHLAAVEVWNGVCGSTSSPSGRVMDNRKQGLQGPKKRFYVLPAKSCAWCMRLSKGMA